MAQAKEWHLPAGERPIVRSVSSDTKRMKTEAKRIAGEIAADRQDLRRSAQRKADQPKARVERRPVGPTPLGASKSQRKARKRQG